MKKKSKSKSKITIQDYIKAVKTADREIQFETSIGWVAVTKVHKSKKAYNRRRDRKTFSEE